MRLIRLLVGEPEEQAAQRAQTDRDLGGGDKETDLDGEGLTEDLDERRDRRDLDEFLQLRADRARPSRAKECRVDEFVGACIDEGHAKEDAQWQEGQCHPVEQGRRVRSVGFPAVLAGRLAARTSRAVERASFQGNVRPSVRRVVSVPKMRI